MQKAFIFDMDGVLVNSEQTWKTYGSTFLPNLVGKEIARKIGDTIGMTVNTTYGIAVKNGFTMDKNKFLKIYDQQASRMYKLSTITKDADKLADYLLNRNYHLGLVSSSRQNWIDQVLPKLPFAHKLEYIISINDRPDLKPKPYPDGYLEAIEKLGASPKTTIILEDSKSGIKAARASGAYTIGFSGNLVNGYTQTGADVYAKTMTEVIQIVNSL